MKIVMLIFSTFFHQLLFSEDIMCRGKDANFLLFYIQKVKIDKPYVINTRILIILYVENNIKKNKIKGIYMYVYFST